MRFRFIKLTALSLILFTSCNSNEKQNSETVSENSVEEEEVVIDSHTSENSLDWEGTYVGTLPCGDCDGIERTITIKEQAFKAKDNHLGKKDGVFESRGYIKWIDNGQKIVLSDDNGTTYFVGENTLTQLDKSGNKITGELADSYILKKLDRSKNNTMALTDTKWKLISLMGQDVTSDKPFITFSSENNNVFGNGSCNNFNGTYKLKDGNQIQLSELASTMMACPDMTIEEEFTKALAKVDNYALNGNQMTLNKGKMAPLAVFEAVE